jgi:hypothetical protein
MFGSLRRFSHVLNAFIASPFGLQSWQSMTRQTVYRRPVFRNGAPRAMAAACPMHRDEGSTAVFKGVFRRNLDLADLRKLSARMAVPYRALNSSRTPFGNKPF